MLEAAGLVKSYGSLRAVDGVSFLVRPGGILGLLGPNGAGKTTTVSMLCGLLAPDSGQVLIQGEPLKGDADPKKRLVGLVPQDLALYEDLTARDNLTLFGGLYGMGRRTLDSAMTSALQLVGLSDRADEKVKTFSGGMKRRLNLAAGILHDPPILLLDEPTVGVDPQSRNAIFENLEVLRDRGKALLYTTHYMEEAERLCDHLVILDHGRVIAEGTLQELAGRLPRTNRLDVELERPEEGEWLGAVRLLGGVLKAELVDRKLEVTVEDLTSVTPAVLACLSERGVAYTQVASERAGLEDIFLSLTGRSLRDA